MGKKTTEAHKAVTAVIVLQQNNRIGIQCR